MNMENEVTEVPSISVEETVEVVTESVAVSEPKTEHFNIFEEDIKQQEAAPSKRRRRKKTDSPARVPEGHCPACFLGQDAAKGEGTHLLNTAEHPYIPPAPVPEKPVKQPRRPMAKELRGAANFAEKMLPKKIAEKARLQGELVRVEAEIQEYTRVLQALGGQMPIGLPPAPIYHQPVTMAAIMGDAPLSQYPGQPHIATVPPVSRAGGGTVDMTLAAPVDELTEDAFLTERSTITGGGGWV